MSGFIVLLVPSPHSQIFFHRRAIFRARQKVAKSYLDSWLGRLAERSRNGAFLYACAVPVAGWVNTAVPRVIFIDLSFEGGRLFFLKKYYVLVL